MFAEEATPKIVLEVLAVVEKVVELIPGLIAPTSLSHMLPFSLFLICFSSLECAVPCLRVHRFLLLP